jgi:hypothetical protein
MGKVHPHVPIGLPISAVILVILGIIAGPIIQSSFSEKELATNVLLSAIPFILIFVAIVLAFMSVIWLVTTVLSHNIPVHFYRPVETIIIVGIVLGVISMFQPWSFALYKIGFYILLVSTLSFILWSHIVPKRRRRGEEAEGVSAADFEQQSEHAR